MIHELKTLPQYFSASADGTKPFEVRKNDRPYRIGDYVALNEFDGENYTGNSLIRKISYILDNPAFCKENYVVLGLETCSIITADGQKKIPAQNNAPADSIPQEDFSSWYPKLTNDMLHISVSGSNRKYIQYDMPRITLSDIQKPEKEKNGTGCISIPTPILHTMYSAVIKILAGLSETEIKALNAEITSVTENNCNSMVYDIAQMVKGYTDIAVHGI